MAADMPNYSEVVDNVNYMNLGCLGTGATISQYQDKMKLANDEECEIKVLRGPTMEAGDVTDPKEIKEMIYKLGDNVTFFSFTMKEFETMVKKTGGTIKRLSGDVRQSASRHYRIVPINLCGTYPRITRQFVTISSWWQRCFNNTMSSAMWPSANATYSRGDTASQCFRSWLATTIC